MSSPNAVFDESWYRVKDRHLRLMPGVELVRQFFKGERWYVVCDKLGHQYFRIRPEAYAFVGHLEKSQSVEAAWERMLRADPKNSPSQGDVVQLLSQLYRSGLLRGDKLIDVDALAYTRKTEDKKKRKQQFSNFLFLKIPLFNPDPLLRPTLGAFSWFFSPLGVLLWLGMFIWGVQTLAVNWDEFRDGSEGLLGLSNLPWLYLALVITKTMHEFGHAYACRRYGREVPEMGIMLLVFNPLPYMDASASYAYTRTYRRVFVGLAGMYVEIFVAALAMLYWANSGEGTLSRLAYNMAITASVSTVLFNLNPLLRFDGYHILTDLTETPNLQSRAQKLMKYWIHRYPFGIRKEPIPASSRSEATWMTVYFIASWIYRIFLLIGILFFVSKQWLIAGLIIAAVFSVMWLVVPVVKAVHYLFTGTQLMNKRFRALSVTAGFFALLFGFLWFVPMPHYFRVSGIVQSDPFANIYTEGAGQVVAINTPSGSFVTAGTVLMTMENVELEEEARLMAIEARRIETLIQSDRSVDGSQLAGLIASREALAARRASLAGQIERLQVKSGIAGRWIAPSLHEFSGSMVPRGAPLGLVRGEESFRFSAVVRQRDVDQLFTNLGDTAEVKLFGEESTTARMTGVTPIPADQSRLPSASLGVMGGGSMGVDTNQGDGAQSSEPFFEIRGQLLLPATDIANHGQGGIARLRLPDLPYGRQWYLRIRQAFQREYQL